MENVYRLFRRAGIYYLEHKQTRKQESLRTGDRREAVLLLNARNEAVRVPMMNLMMGRAYLAAHDPKLVNRMWAELPEDSEPACMAIGPKLEELLRELPTQGALFPHLINSSDSDRASEFRRRCRTVGITGISLHSYRYSWAQRAKAAGYPERWAQAALGHNSRAVHQAYARGAKVICPSLEDYQRKVIPLPTSQGFVIECTGAAVRKAEQPIVPMAISK